MTNWEEASVYPITPELIGAVGGNQLLSEILARRGITTTSAAKGFLDPTYYTPSAADRMPGVEMAAELLDQAIKNQELICVWGDFDVDGQTSTALLKLIIQHLGGTVVTHLPVREVESHGVNVPQLSKLINEFSPKILLTCDTGITSHSALEYALEHGMLVIISDHHELPSHLPPANVIVTPRFLESGDPLASLPGVGVAYKLAEMVLMKFGQPDQIERYTDLAALGIVADLAGLTGEARFLVQTGLARLRKEQRPGLAALIDLAEINPANLTEEHVGFSIAPRLNAIGRLGDANLALELLTTDDWGKARMLAVQMEGMNSQRKFLTEQVFRGALAELERDTANQNESVIVLAHPEWPVGILGLVASRLVERLGKPVLLISSPPGVLARGSARSVPGVDITEAIKSQAGLLESFGGHPMAAGITIDVKNINSFRNGLARAIRGKGPLSLPGLLIEKQIPIHEMSPELAVELERLAPFGPANRIPVFSSPRMHIKKVSRFGRDLEHLVIDAGDDHDHVHRLMWWNGTDEELPEGLFDLAYTVRPITYDGKPELAFTWVDSHPVIEVFELKTREMPQIHDLRHNEHPLALLRQVYTERAIQVWAEGQAIKRLAEVGITARTPMELDGSEQLAIWTTPPDPKTLLHVLEKVEPKIVYIFAIDPKQDMESTELKTVRSSEAEAFIKYLSGLVKYALSNHKQVQINQLAALTAQSEDAVQAGLAWLMANGTIEFKFVESGDLWIERGQVINEEQLVKYHNNLSRILAENQAYRNYFQNATTENLFYFSK